MINLAGAPLNRRWTAEYRREIYDSRIGTTRAIVEAIRSQEAKPDLFIFASAVGYYPAKGCYGESDARKGEGFLADVCRNREAEAIRVPPQVRYGSPASPWSSLRTAAYFTEWRFPHGIA